MAISRGAGTEIIRCIKLNIVDSTTSDLIIGVQHHIYTVLSVIIYARDPDTPPNWVRLTLLGYDSKAGTSDLGTNFFQQDMNQAETFVFNDRFSFNGYEPVDFTGPMDDATKQDAIADQGSSVAQKLQIITEHADDNFDVFCTYIDQNNS